MAQTISVSGDQTVTKMTALFRAGGSLSPRSTAFDESIYYHDSGSFAHTQDVMHFCPQVIGSPRLSGKTTQVKTIASYHERLRGQGNTRLLFCDMAELRPLPSTSSAEIGVDEELLRNTLASRLATTPRGSLRDILRRSPILGGPRTVLAIINSELITTSALRWLLTGFRATYEDEKLRLEKKIHLLIDGSFSVETLTAGPDSDYPLPQAYPPEFNEQQQASFLSERLRSLRLRPTRSALRFLWDQTAGDKYLTQVVGHHFSSYAPRGTGPSLMPLEIREMRVPLENRTAWWRLFRVAAGAVGSMALELALCYEPADRLFLRLIPDWRAFSPAFRGAAYNGGLVRRTSTTTVQMRAPMIVDSLQEPLRNANRVLGLLHSSFSLSGVAPDDYSFSRSSVNRILRASARNRLMSLHVGHGYVTTKGVQVRAIALEGGTYEATWRTPTKRYPIGTPLWALLSTIATKRGHHTDMQLFGVKPQTNLRREALG